MRELNPPERKFIECKLCTNECIDLDEYCQEHQRCYYCGEREECDCKDCRCGRRLDDEFPMCKICRN